MADETGTAKTEMITVRLALSERTELQRRATALGVTLSAYIRLAALRARLAVVDEAAIAPPED